MYNHEPLNYSCPFCRIIRQSKLHGLQSSDVIYSSELATAFLALGRWPNNPIDVLIIPNSHFENIFDLPLEYAPDIHKFTRAVAVLLKIIYQCHGVSTRQHNEPAGNQDVWHYHVHLTPRFDGDNFYSSKRIPFPEDERLEHAARLREYMQKHALELFPS